jgi:glycosyltransferase involved in cell wall biosynthesis
MKILNKLFVSVVVPLYNEEKNVGELTIEIMETMRLLPYPFEVLLINDGSKDDTAHKIEQLSNDFPEVKGIDLAGNYGQTIALRVGFEHAEGDVIVAMDGDLQHDPVYIPQFLQLIEQGYDLVGGSKEKRPDSWLRSALSQLAHGTISNVAGVKMSYFGATFKAYRSYLLENVNMLGDTHRFLGAIVARKGVRYIEVPITIRERKHGQSSYKITKMFRVILDLFFLKFFLSYMRKPFRFFGSIGLVVFSIGFVICVSFMIGNFAFKLNIKDYFLAEFLFSIALVLGGMMFLSIGILAEMGSYNYFNKNQQQPYTIRNVFSQKGETEWKNVWTI